MTTKRFTNLKMRQGLNNADTGDILVDLIQAMNRNRVMNANFTDVTDSTGGTSSAAGTIAALTLPVAYVTLATDCSPKAGLDTELGKLENLQASFGNAANRVMGALSDSSTDRLSWTTGTITAAMPAQDLTLTAVTGTTVCAEAVTGIARLTSAMNNFSTALKFVNNIAKSIGFPLLTDNSGGLGNTQGTLAALAATATGVSGALGAEGLSDTVVDTFLTALVSNWATLINHLNLMTGAPAGDLTDSSGGSVSATNTIAAQAAPAAFTTLATDCSPKAGFDTALGVIEDNQSDLLQRINLLRRRHGLSLLTDSTGSSPDTTLASQSVNLTAVTGTTVCVDRTTALVSLTAVRNNSATLTAALAPVLVKYGITAVTDSSGGTASTTTLVDVPTTTTGNDGSAAATIADTVMDALLAVIRNTNSTLAALCNLVTNTDPIFERPANVIIIN